MAVLNMASLPFRGSILPELPQSFRAQHHAGAPSRAFRKLR